MEATSPATASTLPLSDDVLLEIVALVADKDEAALFRCATTCQRWRSLIADPTFLRRCWPENASSLVGFFTQQSRLDHESSYRGTCTIVHAFLPGPRSPHSSPVNRILGTFVPAADAMLEHATPLTSRAGLILLRAVDPNCRTVRLSVCSPLAGTSPGTGTNLTGARDLLPPLERFRVLYYALLTAADFRSKPGFYKVMAIGFSCGDIKKYTILTFSSGDPSWSEPEIVDPPSGLSGGLWALQGQGAAVVAQGTAHWLLRDTSSFYTLNVSANTGQHSLKMLSSISPSQQLPLGTYKYDARLSVTSDGTLLLVCMHMDDFHVLTWTRQQDDTEECIPTRRIIKLTKPFEYIYGLRCLCMAERGGTLLIAGGIDERLYIANLETAQVEQITDAQVEEITDDDSTDLRYTSAEPFEVDWPTFFMSRIGVQ